MAEQTIEWEEDATRMLQQAKIALRPRQRARQMLEETARQRRQTKVTAGMVQELVKTASRWGWGGALYENEQRAQGDYWGFLAAGDADEEARRLKQEAAERDNREPIVDLCREVLGLGPGAKVLDLGCGFGRAAVPLAREGFTVTAVDMDEGGIGVARAWAEQEGVDVSLFQADVRQFLAESEGEFDATISIGLFFSTPNVSESDKEAEELLVAVSRLLKPGGYVLIGEIWNRDYIIRTASIEGGTAVRQFWQELGPGSFRLGETRFHADEGRRYFRDIRIERGGAPRESRVVDRVYTLPDVRTLLANAGMAMRRQWSDPRWGTAYQEFTPESQLMAVLAQKEA